MTSLLIALRIFQYIHALQSCQHRRWLSWGWTSYCVTSRWKIRSLPSASLKVWFVTVISRALHVNK